MCALLTTMKKQFSLATPVESSLAQQGRSYFWTHGITSNKYHTSGTCKNKANNHKDTATWTNKMGGLTHSYQKHC